MNLSEQLTNALAGRYEVEREIGRGGMATVYLARDIRHKRPVALKVLNPELGALLGAERFLAEIQVTANLQHPNLLPLFDSGEAAGLLFYVMPYVQGESLRSRLDREKQLPVAEAVRVGVCVAGALDYAHRHGVIHRDLKPENILLHEGQPLVADFGIALAVSNAGGNRITQTGLSLGTPQYMSPEQATGDRAIDGRTDVYSLGAVVYEMLTGDPPHTGSTAQAVIARVLTDKPRSVRASRETVPEHVDRALDRALAKLPADRWATAREMAEALDGRGPVGAGIGRSFSNESRASGLRRIAPLFATAVVLAFCAGAVSAWIVHSRSGAPVARSRFALALEDSVHLRTDLIGAMLAISPDGSKFVYVGGNGAGRLYLRELDDLTPRAIPGTENARNPQFSPDGRWIAFTVDSKLKKMPVAGGPSTIIAESVGRFSWGDDERVVYSGEGGGALYRVSSGGGTVEELTHLDTTRGDRSHTWPFVLPGARAVLFTVLTGSMETSQLAVASLADQHILLLGVTGVNPRYAENGYIVFGRLDGTIAGVPFDLGSLKVTGPPVTLLDNVLVKAGGATPISISRTGTLVYARGEQTRLVFAVDRAGHARPLRTDPQKYGEPRVSPDGNRLALKIGVVSGGVIWVQDLASGTLSRLTQNEKADRLHWATNERLAWHASDRGTSDLHWQAWNGSGAPDTLLQSADDAAFSPRGDFFIATVSSGARDVVQVYLDSSRRQTKLFGAAPRNPTNPRISPNGRWVAYTSSETGRAEVFVRALSGAAGVHQISTDGGSEVVWAPSGRELFYRSAGRVLAATVDTAPVFRVVRRDTLFTDVYSPGVSYTNYDIMPNGKEFVFLQDVAQNRPPVIVTGWLDELRERMTQRPGK